MEIKFHKDVKYSLDFFEARFIAEYEGRFITCRVTHEALLNDFGCTIESEGNFKGAHEVACCRKNLDAIEKKAEQLISNRQFGDDGSVLIRSTGR